MATVHDNIVRLGLAQFGPKLSVMDYMNLALGGDIQKYGYGYAIQKNFGGGSGGVTKNKKAHYNATALETMSDAQHRYYASAVSLP